MKERKTNNQVKLANVFTVVLVVLFLLVLALLSNALFNSSGTSLFLAILIIFVVGGSYFFIF